MRYLHLLPVAAFIASGIACRATSKTPAPPDSSSKPTEVSSNDQFLLATVKTALPPPGITPVDLPEPGSTGAKSLADYCAQCHNLPSPSMHSATDWPSVVRRMWLRMDRLPVTLNIRIPDEGTRVLMVGYLTSNALQVSGSTLPPGLGREEFAMICSRCHALPDPRVHSTKDWLTVFMRMERNMERMNVRPPTPEETSRILTYLQSPSTSRR
jgi:hypothetical protein